MRLLFVARPAWTIGGSYRWLEKIAERLPEARFEVRFALSSSSCSPDQFMSRFPSVQKVILRTKSGTAAGRQRAIATVILDWNPDVVVPHLVGDTYGGLQRARKRGSEAKLLFIGHEIAPRMLADLLDFRTTVDMGVAVSRAIEMILHDIIGLESRRVRRIPYGVPAPAAKRAENGEVLRIGYAGRLDADKRPDDVIEICREISRRGVPYELEIAGEGESLDYVARSLAPQIRQGEVRMLGPLSRDELYRFLYPKWDCMLRCSDSEGFPIAVTEAMVNGCIPVVSDFEGRRNEGLIEHMKTGLVFPIGSITDAADCLCSLSRDRRLRSALSKSAAEETAGFTEYRMAASWAELLEDLAGWKPREYVSRHLGVHPSGRLDRIFGTEMGESLRGLFRFRPTDTEWPFANHDNDDLVGSLKTRIVETLGNI